jgi:hypothetical protein
MALHLLPTRTLRLSNLVPGLTRFSAYQCSQPLPWTAFRSHIPTCHKSTLSKRSPAKAALHPNPKNASFVKSSQVPTHAATRATAPSAPKPGYQPYAPVRPPPRPQPKPQRPQWPPRPEPGGRQGLSPALAGWLMGVVFMGAAYGLAWWYDVKLLTDRWWMSAVIMVFLLFLVF